MISFSDLDTDPLAEILEAPVERRQVPADAPPAMCLENCRKCGGTGQYRHFGRCFACKGKGRFSYVTSPEARAANRERAASRRADVADDNWKAFADSHEAAAAWITREAPRFDFAAAMREAVRKYGSLTERQLEAVNRCVAKAAERTAARDAAQAAASGPLDVSKLDECFAVAREQKAVKAAIRTGTVVFSLAPLTGRNPGSIYVKDRSTGTYLGKIAGGKFAASYACTPANAADIAEAAADPKAAALRYARMTDECSVCGRLLTDPESKAAGIGPKCATKFGW